MGTAANPGVELEDHRDAVDNLIVKAPEPLETQRSQDVGEEACERRRDQIDIDVAKGVHSLTANVPLAMHLKPNRDRLEMVGTGENVGRELGVSWNIGLCEILRRIGELPVVSPVRFGLDQKAMSSTRVLRTFQHEGKLSAFENWDEFRKPMVLKVPIEGNFVMGQSHRFIGRRKEFEPLFSWKLPVQGLSIGATQGNHPIEPIQRFEFGKIGNDDREIVAIDFPFEHAALGLEIADQDGIWIHGDEPARRGTPNVLLNLDFGISCLGDSRG